MVVIAAVIVLARSFRDIKELPQGHTTSKQQLTRLVFSLFCPL